MTLTIRARFTVWYSALMAAVLIAFSTGVLWLHAGWGRAQFDGELTMISGTVSRVMDEEIGEAGTIDKAAEEASESIDVPDRTTAVLDRTGRSVFAHWRGFPYSSGSFAALVRKGPGISTIDNGGGAWRLVVTPRTSAAGDYIIVVAGSLNPLARQQQLLGRTFMVATPVVVFFAGVFCWWIASSALRPMTAMAAEAEAITARSIDRQLSIEHPDDEIGQFARAFNRLLDRLRSALQTQRQFMADAAHELRTPVSVVRTTAEVTLDRDERDPSEYREALTIVRDQSTRLGRMVEDMLVLAKADAGGYPVTFSPVYLDEVVEECVRGVAVLAESRGLRIEQTAAHEVAVVGDEQLLHQLLMNLLQNAIRYSASGRTIRVSLSAAGPTASLSVIDSGSGIPAADRERVFGRFVRLDPARASDAGAGLGLPIARWIAELHGGTLTLEDNPAGGCTFVARLPVMKSTTP